MTNTNTPGKWSDFDKWLRGEHLQGKPVTVTIERATIEKVYANGAPVTVPCLWFKGTRKGLLLNAGNRRTLARLFGDNASAVIGKRIAIAPAQIGERVTVQIGEASGARA